MGNNIQKTIPVRTCNEDFPKYTDYRLFLRDDFNNRCGYCDDDDFYSGGVRGYHIDHFKPKKHDLFPELMNEYSNLVYSCSYCNQAKSFKWKEDGFVDPCSNEYNNHLSRNEDGRIQHISERGKYIFYNLKLYLLRHDLLWSLDRLKEQKEELKEKINVSTDSTISIEDLKYFYDIQIVIDEYTDIFGETI